MHEWGCQKDRSTFSTFSPRSRGALTLIFGHSLVKYSPLGKQRSSPVALQRCCRWSLEAPALSVCVCSFSASSGSRALLALRAQRELTVARGLSPHHSSRRCRHDLVRPRLETRKALQAMASIHITSERAPGRAASLSSPGIRRRGLGFCPMSLAVSAR